LYLEMSSHAPHAPLAPQAKDISGIAGKPDRSRRQGHGASSTGARSRAPSTLTACGALL
jgi:hypothetical protein